MFERFTDRSRRVLVLAQEEVRLLDHDAITTEHLLLGLIGEGDSVAARSLASAGVSLDAARAKVRDATPPSGRDLSSSPPFSDGARKALELALSEALQLGHQHLGPEHLLLGVVGEGGASDVLAGLGVDSMRLRQEVITRAGGVHLEEIAAVDGAAVAAADVPMGLASNLGRDDVAAVLAAGLLPTSHTTRAEADGVVYETCRYHLLGRPEISVSVAAASVTRAAFESYTSRIPEAQPVEGLGDLATYSPVTFSLRVLSGTMLLVVVVKDHPHPREAAETVAKRALAGLGADGGDQPGLS